MENIAIKLLNFLKENVKDVSSENITYGESEGIPRIEVYCLNSEIIQKSIGESERILKEERIEYFNGTGSRRNFKLKELPIRPLVSVESPKGHILRENVDFNVDYVKGIVSFKSAPEKGKNNVIIKYYSSDIGVEHLTRFKAEYAVKIFAKTCEEIDTIASRIMVKFSTEDFDEFEIMRLRSEYDKDSLSRIVFIDAEFDVITITKGKAIREIKIKKS